MSLVKLAPSVLAADFARLGEQVKEADEGGADRIHVDVMDGHFVPNISFGPVVVRALRKVTKLPLETHLMIDNPDQYLDEFAAAGSDSLLVHVEGNWHLHRTLQHIHKLNVRAGVVINPATPISAIAEVLPLVQLVLVMTVNPGFGGQAFLDLTLPKIQQLRHLLDDVNPKCELEVDGGIDATTAPRVVAAGAGVLVAGSAVFNSPLGVQGALRQLQQAVTA